MRRTATKSKVKSTRSPMLEASTSSTLEGNGSLYQRPLNDFIELDSSNKHTAWVYYIMRDMNGEPRKKFTVRGTY